MYLVEVYQYEEDVRFNGRRGRKVSSSARVPSVDFSGEDLLQRGKQIAEKRKDNVRRTCMVFRRLIKANLDGSFHPLFISLTYAKDITDVRQGHKDFNAFARNLRNKFGSEIRYIAVPEFQKRGRLHFHALLWGVEAKKFADSERSTRLFAGLWGQGFVDLKATDGDPKIASYLAKYMQKTFVDYRLLGKKAFIASRNIIRPIVDKQPFLVSYFTGGLEGIPDLSTATLVREKEYVTQWLGKGRFKLYQLKHK